MASPGAYRRVGVVPGGIFQGERLSGEILDGGSDWQSVRSDGSTILVTYRGIRQGPPDAIARLEKGEVVDPASYYFRIAPLFETEASQYKWLNNVIAIGIGHRVADGPIYNVFEVL